MIRQVLTRLFAPAAYRGGLVASGFATQPPKKEVKDTKPVDEDDEDDEGRKVRAEEQSQFVEQKENRRNLGWTIWRIIFWSSTAIYSYQLYLVLTHNKKTPVDKQTGAVPLFMDAAKLTVNTYHELVDFFTKPPMKKFLPDPFHPALQMKTLVVNLSGTLIHSDFKFGKGMQIIKRPGLEQFLERLSYLYEIVIYTDDDFSLISTAMPFVDRQGLIHYHFGRESMVLSKGKYYKDISYLNRQMRKIVVLDKNTDKVPKQKRNVITLPEFKGQEDDHQLAELLPLLEHLASAEVRDVRPILENLGPESYHKYYEMMKQKQEKIKQKTGWLGFLKKKDQKL